VNKLSAFKPGSSDLRLEKRWVEIDDINVVIPNKFRRKLLYIEIENEIAI